MIYRDLQTAQSAWSAMLASIGASTMRSNLGLGSAAERNVGTSGANVPLMSTANTFGTDQRINGHILADTALPSRHTQTSGYKAVWVGGGSNCCVIADTASGYRGISMNANIVRHASLAWAHQDTSQPAWTCGMTYETATGYEGWRVSRSAPTAGSGSFVTLLEVIPSGNVGIGTAGSPSFPLTVRGGASNNDQLGIIGQNNAGYTNFHMQGTGRTYQIGLGNGGETLFGVASKYFIYDRNANAMRFVIDTNGFTGVGTAAPTAGIDVAFDTMRLRTSRTPSSASATGNQGDYCWDANYEYRCVATNTWKRAALSTW